AYTIPAVLNFVYSAYFARKVFNLHYGFLWDVKVFKLFIAFALPFAIAGIVGRLYSYSDSLIMSKLLSNQELGWWSVPYKITFAFQFIPVALSASIFPVMSSLYIEDKTKISALFEKSWRYLFMIVFPLSFGLFVLAEPAIIKLYRADYFASIPVLQILVISLIFGFLSLITGALLNATNKQRTQTTLLAVCLAVNIIINLILIPRWGIMGAATAALTSNILLWIGGFYFASREIPMRYGALFKFANQSFWPALIMAFVVNFLAQKMHFIITVPIGAMVYAMLLFVTGGINYKMIKQVVDKVYKVQPEEPMAS
ncbi:MAG: polysaccharide biosynthesis C-terminal domain-containing protein, partial [bacterium]